MAGALGSSFSDLRRTAQRHIYTSQGHTLSLYPEVPEVLERLKNNNIRLIVASCTPDADV